MDREAIQAQTLDDLARLRIVVDGIQDLERQVSHFASELAQALEAEGRSFYRPDEDDRIRWLFTTYLAYRTTLLRLIATYSGFAAVQDPDAKARCFMLAYAAIAHAFESGLKLVKRYRDEPLLRRKLNEAEPAWGIPAGMFDRIRENIANERNLNLFEEMSAYFERKRETWHSDGVWPEEDFNWIEEEIRGSLEYVRQNQDDRHLEWAAVFFNRVKQDAYSPVNALQELVGELVGGTRVIARPTFVSVEMIKEYEHLLEPGDIILERRSWLLSNAFLPGFWPHAALYVGRLEDLRELGIADHPAVRERMESYLALASDGEPHTIIEALEPGVIFNSTTRSMRTDYLAVLRPRLTKQQKAKAVVKAFRHQGKPYDFSFDFSTSDRLVCTELIYRSFQGLVNLELIRVMGRDTLPAVEIARKFVLERGRPDRELELVLFLDGNPATGKAEWADEDAFCDTLKRTREFNE